MVPGIKLLISTVGDLEAAERIARTMVEEGKVACVNIVPGIRSFYRWNGELQDDAECLLLLKTQADRSQEAISTLVDLHPYDLPEVIALDVTEGHQDYLDWLIEMTRQPRQRRDT